MACGRYKDRLGGQPANAEDAERSFHEEPSHQDEHVDYAEGSEHPKVLEEAPLPSHHADHYEFPPGMEAAIRRITKETADEIVNTMLTMRTMPVDAGELPPEPKTTGKSQDRKYKRVTLTIDENLWKQFELERTSLGITSRGRMADILLWRALGRPKLSFEEPEQ